MVRVIDHGAEGTLFFLVMELLSGEDLFDVLAASGGSTRPSRRRVLVEMCDALAEAHAQGIVHRDLKPENVFLARARRRRARVKVLDFGVAKMMIAEERSDGEPESLLTAMGALLGTPEYISPEMCRGEVVGPSADIYSCGVLLYALLTGQPPFVTVRPLDVVTKHILDRPRPPRELVPDLDPALEAIVLQALEKQPGARQPSAGALADALRALGPAPPLLATLLGGPAPLLGSSPSATLAHAVTVSLPADDDDALASPIAPIVAPVEIPVPPPVVEPAPATSGSRGGVGQVASVGRGPLGDRRGGAARDVQRRGRRRPVVGDAGSPRRHAELGPATAVWAALKGCGPCAGIRRPMPSPPRQRHLFARSVHG